MMLDLSDEQLSKTHKRTSTIEPDFMFHDLYGNPMMIRNMEIVKWVPMNKGAFNELCYRSACPNNKAVFYNYSTREYYCAECAKLINEANKYEAHRLYGHNLCLLKTEPVKPDEL